MLKPKLTRHPHGITAVDAEYVRPGHAAVHIIEHGGRAAFVDTGTADSVPYLMAALAALGIESAAVDFVFLTHVHLDHAGGAGRLMQELPNARAILHPRGAPHMIDPAKLIAGSVAVYGEQRFRQLYGQIVPIAANRVRVTRDFERLELAGRRFEIVHTPGHALHHHCLVDLDHAGIFSGDTFGISYREFDTENGAFITPTTTPTQFDPEQLIASIERLEAYAPQSMYLMHYSRVTGIARLSESLKSQIRDHVRIARRHAGAPGAEVAIRSELGERWRALARRHGVTLPDAELDVLLEDDLELNAQGLMAWLERAAREPRA